MSPSMSPERHQRLIEVFELACDLQGAARQELLDRECAGDHDLRREVEQMLGADELAAGYLEQSPDDLAAGVLSGQGEEPPSDEETDWIGQCIGPYRVTGLIGRGGMGAVYRAVREDDFRMEVAIKLLNRGTETSSALSRFRTERKILAGLQHPNIARMLDGGATVTGLPYFVMEYVDGKQLLAYAAPLAIRARLKLFRDICSAVAYLHQNLIVHRDIKPANIVVTRDGVPKLLDFGIAKLLDPAASNEAASLTGAGARLMTPHYASPEQVRGEPVTTVTDVYSLGAVLYELLTGQRPHRIESHAMGAIEKAICLEEAAAPSAVIRDLDRDLDNIVLMALRKEPERRYASVESLSGDIGRHLEGMPVMARKDTLRYRTVKFLRRNRLRVAAVTMVLLGAIAAAAAVNQQAQRAERRFQQVRKLARTVLFDLNNEIAPLAGATKARELLLRTSLEYLDSLASEAAGDAPLQLELAAAYKKVGDVQGNPFFSNLGHPDRSIASYRKANELAEKAGTSKRALEIQSASHLALGAVQWASIGNPTEARKSLETAAAIAESIPRLSGDPAYAARSQAYSVRGHLEKFYDPRQAVAATRRSQDVVKQWVAAKPSPLAHHALAIGMVSLGEALWYTGDLAGAQTQLLDAVSAWERLLKENPGNSIYRRELAGTYEFIGCLLGHPQFPNRGDRKAALEWIGKSFTIRQKSLAADVNDERARQDLATASSEFAAMLGESNPRQAEDLYRQALRLCAEVLQAAPGDPEALNLLTFHQTGFSMLLQKLGRNREAASQLDQAVSTLEGLMKTAPADERFQQALGAALHTRAALRIAMRDAEAANRDLLRSLDILQSLYSKSSARPSLLQDLADCYEVLGTWHASNNEWRKARDWYGKSLQLWERWKDIATVSEHDTQRRARVARLASAASAK